MDKRFWAIIGVIVVLFGGLLVWQNKKSDNGTTGSTKGQPTNHVIGNTDSKVTLLEYGDYQCPACEAYFTTVQEVQQKYNDKIKFQFRNLPLSQIHKNAIGGARAAEAADLQGKFWQMHDALYAVSNWQVWSNSNDPEPQFQLYAKQLGLNVDQFKKDFASSKVNDRIQADVAAFKKTGRDMSTPTFFVNDEFVANTKLMTNGVPSVEAFSKVIDEALKKSGQ